MVPGVMVTVSKSEKVLWVHGGKTEDDFICENQIMQGAEAYCVATGTVVVDITIVNGNFSSIVYFILWGHE